jgi:hypothetical protein
MVVNEGRLVVARGDALRIPRREQRLRGAYVRRGTGLLEPAGAAEAGLVEKDNELGPVPRAELHHRPADVRFAVAGLTTSRSAISLLESPAATSVMTSRYRSVSNSRAGLEMGQPGDGMRNTSRPSG